MTKEKCQELNIGGIEYVDKYDGVWDWYCPVRNSKVCRWLIDEDGKTRFSEDPAAFDKLCEGCTIPDEK